MDEYWDAELLWCNPSRDYPEEWVLDISNSPPSEYTSQRTLEEDGYWSMVYRGRGGRTHTSYCAFAILLED